MMRFFGFLFFTALVLGAWGFHKDWFSVQTSERDGTWTITTEVHKHELGRDLDAYEQKLLEALDLLDRKIDDLRARARTANAKSRPAIEQQIEEVERKKGETSELLRDHMAAPTEPLPATEGQVDDALDGGEAAPTPPETSGGTPPDGAAKAKAGRPRVH